MAVPMLAAPLLRRTITRAARPVRTLRERKTAPTPPPPAKEQKSESEILFSGWVLGMLTSVMAYAMARPK